MLANKALLIIYFSYLFPFLRHGHYNIIILLVGTNLQWGWVGEVWTVSPGLTPEGRAPDAADGVDCSLLGTEKNRRFCCWCFCCSCS